MTLSTFLEEGPAFMSDWISFTERAYRAYLRFDRYPLKAPLRTKDSSISLGRVLPLERVLEFTFEKRRTSWKF
jgi:hypothetical protein